MIPFSKNDLYYPNRYSWNSEKNANSSQLPFAGDTIFNRHLGYEVLDLINKTMRLHNLCNLQALCKMETMLINLPFEEQTHRQVSEWIVSNWSKKIPYPENGHLVMAG